jgi:hypothetical protein
VPITVVLINKISETSGELISMVDNNEKPELDDSNKFGMVALKIAISYADGYSSLKFLFEILEIQKNNPEKFLTIPQFFNFLYGICYQSVIINLSNILVDNNESINIYYLRSFIKNYIRQTQNQKGITDLYTTINRINECYPKNCDFYLGLKELRDKYIAHIDKVRFHAAAGPTKIIKLEEIKIAYDSIGNLVGELIGILGINPDLVDFEQLYKANLQFRLIISNLDSNPLI